MTVPARTVLVTVGASAGGVEALLDLVSRLPANLQSAILIVLHIPAAGESVLPDILDRAGPLPAMRAQHDMEIAGGHIVVAPADHHMTVRDTRIVLDRGPRVNGHRPAIDPLFRSAAIWYGSHAMGVLLSGMLDDGASGLLRLNQIGALTVAQDLSEAAYPALPKAAIDRGAAQKVLVIQDIAELIVASSAGEGMSLQEFVAVQEPTEGVSDSNVSPFTCPNCHGTLWEVDDPTGSHFRCRTGHSFSIDSLVEVSTQSLDDALWAGYRALLEQADLCRRMSRRMDAVGNERAVVRYARLATDAERRAWVLRDSLVPHEDSSEVSSEGGRAS